MIAETVIVNKVECSFAILRHGKINSTTDSKYQVQLKCPEGTFLYYNTPIHFQKPYMLSSYSCPTAFYKQAAKKMIRDLPETFVVGV